MLCGLSKLVQRIFKSHDIHNTTLTPDEVPNILIYGNVKRISASSYNSYKLLEMVQYRDQIIGMGLN